MAAQRRWRKIFSNASGGLVTLGVMNTFRLQSPLRAAVRPTLLAGLLALVAGGSSTALAQPGGSGDKAGPLMLNFKLGPAIPLTYKDQPSSVKTLDVLPVAASITLEGGYALDTARRAYLLLPLQIMTGAKDGSLGSTLRITRVVVPVGFQYDIPISAVPGLYIYPRVYVGYMAYIVSLSSNALSLSSTSHGVSFAPEFGVKYVFRRRFNFAFEPFSLPLSYFSGKDVNTNAEISSYILDYRMNLSFGVNL